MSTDEVVLYRPKGVRFLDETNRKAFWKTRKGAAKDFPGEVESFTEAQINEYCKTHGIEVKDLEVYR